MDGMNSIWFAVGTAILFAALFVAFRRWWPRLNGIAPAQRVVLIVTTVGGLIGAFFWWQDIDAAFAWNLPPLASRMLGAAATAFGIAGLYVLERPTYARAWLHALMTAIYLIPLMVAIVLLHLDRFDFAQPLSWGFFAIVIFLSAMSALAISRFPNPSRHSPAAGLEGVFLLVAGLVLAVWGAALFLAPAATWPLIFVWPGDPLTSRLIASMLLTVAFALLAARRDSALLQQSRFLAAVYGLGVVVAIGVNLIKGLPYPELYLGVFAALGIVSGLYLVRDTRRR